MPGVNKSAKRIGVVPEPWAFFWLLCTSWFLSNRKQTVLDGTLDLSNGKKKIDKYQQWLLKDLSSSMYHIYSEYYVCLHRRV